MGSSLLAARVFGARLPAGIGGDASVRDRAGTRHDATHPPDDGMVQERKRGCGLSRRRPGASKGRPSICLGPGRALGESETARVGGCAASATATTGAVSVRACVFVESRES